MHVCSVCAFMKCFSDLAAHAEPLLLRLTTLASRSLLLMCGSGTASAHQPCRLGEGELELRVRMAFGMFDTRGR